MAGDTEGRERVSEQDFLLEVTVPACTALMLCLNNFATDQALRSRVVGELQTSVDVRVQVRIYLLSCTD